jgi:hypothetical protein
VICSFGLAHWIDSKAALVVKIKEIKAALDADFRMALAAYTRST